MGTIFATSIVAFLCGVAGRTLLFPGSPLTRATKALFVASVATNAGLVGLTMIMVVEIVRTGHEPSIWLGSGWLILAIITSALAYFLKVESLWQQSQAASAASAREMPDWLREVLHPVKTSRPEPEDEEIKAFVEGQKVWSNREIDRIWQRLETELL